MGDFVFSRKKNVNFISGIFLRRLMMNPLSIGNHKSIMMRSINKYDKIF